MADAPERTLEQKLEFHYDPSPQRSPEWFAIRLGRIGASRLEDWMSVSRAKGKEGTPLKARLDYEKELMFERQFQTSFETFINGAMQDGIDFEGYAVREFEQATGMQTVEVGCFYNDFMVVSPDRLVFAAGSNVVDFDNAIGVLEIKIVKDNTFTEILMSGVPAKHMKQVQAQLKASGLTRGWYVALNFNTKKFVIIDVEVDTEFADYMMEAIQEELVFQPFALDYVHPIQNPIPEGIELGAEIDRSDSNITPGGEPKRKW